MKKAYTIATLFFILIIIINGLLITSRLSFGLKIWFTQSSFVALLHIAAVIMLLLALKGFRERIKLTCLFICGSMLITAFGLTQDIALFLLNESKSSYVLLGGTMLPYVIMMFLAYFGIRLLAKQIQLKSILLNPWFSLGLSILVASLVILIPTPRTDYPKIVITIATFVDALVVLLMIVTALAVKTMQQVSRLYKPALRWVAIYYGSVAVITFANVIAEIYLPHTHWYWVYGISYSVYNFTAIAAVIMALRFTQIAYAENEILKQTDSKKQTGQTNNSVDVVVFLALLVSNRNSVDKILDQLRELTASMDRNSTSKLLSSDQQAKTAHIYLQLEEFLITQEPVRKFTKPQIRQMIDIRFKDSVEEPIFWQNLSS